MDSVEIIAAFEASVGFPKNPMNDQLFCAKFLDVFASQMYRYDEGKKEWIPVRPVERRPGDWVMLEQS
jgi:hypothetical protein